MYIYDHQSCKIYNKKSHYYYLNLIDYIYDKAKTKTLTEN